MCVDAINVTDVVNVVLQHAIVLTCNSPYKSGELQWCIQKLTVAVVHIEVVIAVLQTKLINCNSAKKKLSLTSCAHKSYHSFDAILRFLQTNFDHLKFS